MTEPKTEFLGTRICRIVKLASIFWFLFLGDQIWNRPKHKDRIADHDRTPTPTYMESCNDV
jgi:hypothetical protein